jgi:hypothetical protein
MKLLPRRVNSSLSSNDAPERVVLGFPVPRVKGASVAMWPGTFARLTWVEQRLQQCRPFAIGSGGERPGTREAWQ